MLDQGILFIILAFIILGIYLLYPNVITNKNIHEGFTSTIGGVYPMSDSLNQIEEFKGEVENKTVVGYEKVSELPKAPFEGVTSNAPSAYRDLSIENASNNRILELTDNLKAFLTFEAPNLQDTSDPQIQLPLSTARGDLRRLESEAAVISRNPGIRSTLTNEQLLEMSANIDYLRKKARHIIGLSSNNQIEGFSSTYPKRVDSLLEEFTTTVTTNVSGGQINVSGGQITVSGVEKASFQDIENAYSRLMAKKTYFMSLNTSDPEIANKIVKINTIINTLNDIITKINTNQMRQDEITITKVELDNIYSTNQLNSAGSEVPSWLSNLLPSGLGEDPKLRSETSDLLQNYMTNLPKGLSWNLNVGLNYTSENAAKAGESRFLYNKKYGSNGKTTSQTTGKTAGQQINGIFPDINQLDHLSNSSEFQPLGGLLGDPVDPYTNYPELEGRPPTLGSFDWKERAKYIENAVIKRRLNPNDFGIMPKGSEVSDTFSWKGYTKMICNRLMATPDTGLPEACGCPPLNWPGWK